MLDYRLTYQDTLKVLEADIEHANVLAISIPRGEGDPCLQMKLVYNYFAPIFLSVLQWMDCSCTCLLPRYLSLFHVHVYKVYPDGKANVTSNPRKATIREFYTVILPSLERLHENSLEQDDSEGEISMELVVKRRTEEKRKALSMGLDREHECGICLEPSTKMVLPNCCHSMCINCYRDWSTRSESCPFCRGNIKRVNSEDLWVLTCSDDVADTKAVYKDDMFRFYLYINSLPKDTPDELFFVYHEYLI